MSTDDLARFLRSMDLETEDFDFTLEYCARSSINPRQYDFIISKDYAWDYEQLSKFEAGLNSLTYPCAFTFKYHHEVEDTDLRDLFVDWYQSRNPQRECPKIAIRERILYLHYENSEKYQATIAKDFQDLLVFLHYDYRVQIDLPPTVALTREKTPPSPTPPPTKAEESNVSTEPAHSDGEPYFLADGRVSYPKPKNAGFFRELQTISQVQRLEEFVTFRATIFMTEERTFKSGRQMLVIGVRDPLYNAIFVQVDVSAHDNARSLTYLRSFRNKDNIRVYGITRSNFKTAELEIRARYIELLEPDPLRADLHPKKRVELHLHTKMSTMDGVSTIDDYIKLASHMGHHAIGITDHASVQSFPEAQPAAEKYNIKMLYGAEINMIEDVLHYVNNPQNIPLLNAPYVSFDLETTGLSARYDKIIEIGAVKVENGQVVDELSILIDPQMALSAKTIEITGISSADLKGQPSIDQVIDRILLFFGDLILISHNAEFDLGFLNAALVNLGRPELKNPTIDTLSLSRFLFPRSKTHRLGALAKHVNVDYDTEKAHRANYDARVLHYVWQNMLSLLENQKSDITHADLENFASTDIMLKHARPTHVTVYAKNRAGIRSLYELISLGSTVYLSETRDLAKVPRSEIQKRRENLIIGSACQNGDVFDTALTKTAKFLEQKIAFYDFIEVQPLDNYTNLIRGGQCQNIGFVKQILLDIIQAAQKQHKMVVATSDAHYADPEDRVYRDVYIQAKAVGGKFHPLWLRNPDDSQFSENPLQYYRSTTEMLEAFDFLEPDLRHEIVITNSNLIADMIEPATPFGKELYPPKIENSDTRLRELCFENAHVVYGPNLPEAVTERLNRELNGIISSGYSVIYYIAHLIVKKANEDGYMVGSRGSVGSSFAATMAKITEVNPLPPHYLCPQCYHFEFVTDDKYRCGYDLPLATCPKCGHKLIGDGQNIPFSTFLGVDADKVPDIDLNFSEDYQARAHEYTKVLLGENNVFRAGTIGTAAIKTAIGNVRGYLQHLNIFNPTQAQLNMLASGCAGVKRTTGQHPGGIVVIPDDYDVNDFTPIQYPADDKEATWRTTHFDFDSLHDTLLKLDLLGHVDPYALKLMGELSGVDPLTINLNDPKILSLFANRQNFGPENFLKEKTGALGLPEFGTDFVRQVLEEANPQTIADLIAISGLTHGTDVWQGNAQSLINSGICTIRDVIACRDDILLYLTRKGIDESTAFAIAEDVRKGRKVKAEFEKIMTSHNVPRYYIDACNKIKYMFPKAHATAYVTMALRVGYYKVYHPLVYYAVFFSVRTDKYDIKTMLGGKKAIQDRINEIRAMIESKTNENKDVEILANLRIAIEMYERGYRFLPLDLNKSQARMFQVDEERQGLIPPFMVIDSLGATNAATLIANRAQAPFTSKEDFAKRSGLAAKVVASLDEMGVLNGLKESDQISLFDFFD